MTLYNLSRTFSQASKIRDLNNAMKKASGAFGTPQVGTVTLVGGTATVNTGITISSTVSQIYFSMLTPGGGTNGVQYKVTSVTTGGPGTGAFTVSAVSTTGGGAVATDVSVLAYEIVNPYAHLDAFDFTVTAANATDLASVITLANQLKRVYEGPTNASQLFPEGHRANTLQHVAADTTNKVTAADASDQATANTLLNAIKAEFNAHLKQAGVHYNLGLVSGGASWSPDEPDNIVSTADATDLASSEALANALKTAINAHIGHAPANGDMIRLVDA